MKKDVRKKNINNHKKIFLKLRKDINNKKIPHVNFSLIFLSVNTLLVVFVLIITKQLPPEVPLFYGVPRGERQLGASLTLILPLLLSSTFVAVNSVVAYFIASRFLKNILVVGSYFTVILSIITVLKIISLIIYF